MTRELESCKAWTFEDIWVLIYCSFTWSFSLFSRRFFSIEKWLICCGCGYQPSTCAFACDLVWLNRHMPLSTSMWCRWLVWRIKGPIGERKEIRYLLSYHLITKEDEPLQLFQGTVGHLLISEGHESLPSQVSDLSYRYLNDLTIGHEQVIQWDLHLYVPTHSVVNSTIYKWEICLPCGLTFSHRFLTYRVGTGFTTCF